MKLYNASIMTPDEEFESMVALLENDAEINIYDNEEYEILFENTPFVDDDIYYYLTPDFLSDRQDEFNRFNHKRSGIFSFETDDSYITLTKQIQ